MLERMEGLISKEEIENLKTKKIILFGLGGVGSYVAEILVRAGINNLTIVDFDKVDITNINRQLIALHSTIGKLKTEVMKCRLLDINNELNLKALALKIDENNIKEFHLEEYDYVIDVIDDVKAKLAIIVEAKKYAKKIISSMGTGNKLDPTKFKITDISKTEMCPLARVMRKKLKESNINKVNVLFSTEEISKDIKDKSYPRSVAFVPSVAGILIARFVILDLLGRI